MPEYALSYVLMVFGLLFAYETYSGALNNPTTAQWFQIALSSTIGLGVGGAYLYLFAARVRCWVRWSKENNGTYTRPKGTEQPGYGMVVDEVRWFDQKADKNFVLRRVYNSYISSGGRSGPHITMQRYAIITSDEHSEDSPPFLSQKFLLFTPSATDLIDKYNKLTD